MILRRTCSHLIFGQIVLLGLLTLTSCSKDKPVTNSAAPSSGSSAASTTTSSGSKELDACTLVTHAEAEQAMGEKLKDADSGPASMQGGTICRYGSPDSLSPKNVTIRVESPNFNWGKVKEDKRIEGENMRPKRGYIRQVPGLGKDAYFARHVLHVLTDHGILTVIMFKDTADAIADEKTETKTEAAEKALAEKAVTRM